MGEIREDKMKNALILHGGGNNSSGNWFPWLEEELQSKGFKVWLPDLPDSDYPDREKWLKVIFSDPDWEFNEESVIVGHSAGATLALLILEQLPEDIKIDKVILVAGYANKGRVAMAFQYKELMLTKSFNWEKIKNSCKNFVFIASDNDRYDCGEDQARIFHQNLGGELIVMPGEDHFNLEKSPEYREFPELLKMI